MAKNTATSKVSIANVGHEELVVESSVQISNPVIDARPPIHHTATLSADDSPPLSVCTPDPENISDPTCHKPKKRKRNVRVKLHLYFV